MNCNPKVRIGYIGIRVTPEEKAALKEKAAAVGMTLTDYLVCCGLQGMRAKL